MAIFNESASTSEVDPDLTWRCLMREFYAMAGSGAIFNERASTGEVDPDLTWRCLMREF